MVINQPTRKPQFRLRLAISNRLYMILCSVIKVLDMIAKEQQCYHIDIFMILIEISAGWDWERGVLYFTSSPSTAPYIQHVYRLIISKKSFFSFMAANHLQIQFHNSTNI